MEYKAIQDEIRQSSRYFDINRQKDIIKKSRALRAWRKET